MSRKKHATGEAGASPKTPDPAITINEREARGKPVRRPFPGPAGATGQAPFRMAMERDALADLSAHARESLDCEVCGVLAGELCEDDHGLYVHAKAAVRGESARQGSVHVTYTQETWAGIYAEMDRKYPKLQIVGWYHSHPGFGVQFSEMDTFIHRNFFGAPHQVALVIDPLGGQLGVCINRDGGIVYLPRFWVEGREQTCYQPPSAAAAPPEGGPPAPAGAGPSEVERQLGSLDRRLTQVMQALDETRNDFYRTLLFSFCLVATAVIGLVGWQLWKWYSDRGEPPELLGNYSELVRVGDKDVRLSIAVAQWDVPPAISSKVIETDRIRQETVTALSQQIEVMLMELGRRLQADEIDPTRYGLPLPPPEPAAEDATGLPAAPSPTAPAAKESPRP